MSSDFGTYQVSYSPANRYNTEYIEPTINMSISGEADLSAMLAFFDSFLKASGYVYDGKLEIVEPKKVSESKDFYYSNWCGSTTASGVSGASCPSPDVIAIGTHDFWGK